MSDPLIVRSLADLRRAVDGWRAGHETSALVPTMGALHDGHLALIDAARTRTRRVAVSIFVNPTQFSPSEDLATYPRSLETDLALLCGRNVDLVYAPDAAGMYPDGFASGVVVRGPAAAGLEDRFRPQFFGAVATVVAKLFNRCRSEVAVFGEKDYQQFLVVRRMAADLDIPVEIVAVPTARDADGLALSSRNRFLSPAERVRAATLPRVLTAVAGALREGEDADRVLSAGARTLEREGFALDYLEARDAETLGPALAGRARRVLAAARLGTTRLIDNMPV